MRLRVSSAMTARFFDCTIHPVYATFAIVEHGEYAARQAILQFLEADEDAIGTHVELKHLASAPVGAVVEITARVASVSDRTIICDITALWEGIAIARGTQTQRVVDKRKLAERMRTLPARNTRNADETE